MITIGTLYKDAQDVRKKIADMTLDDDLDRQDALEAMKRIENYLETQYKLAVWEATGTPPDASQ